MYPSQRIFAAQPGSSATAHPVAPIRSILLGRANRRKILRPVLAFDNFMTLDEFRKSTSSDAPPSPLSLALAGLWWDAKGDWTKAHESAQEDEGPEGSWVHAYLHRKEGDSSNAAYWYRRAGKPVSRESFAAEWDEIATSLLR